jgi:hypothetical protein
MSNDPLALSGITAGLPQEAEYDAVYAAVTATERGRWFLTQYASRNRSADTEVLVAAIARVEAAVRGDAVPQSGAVSGPDLAEIAAEIERIGAAIGAGQTHAPDIAAAAERILDITFELREHAVKTTLCDALDAAVREISDACSAGKANGNGAHDAAQMLRDLGHRVDSLITLSREGVNAKPDADEISDQNVDSAATPVEAVSVVISQREGAADPGSIEIFSAPAGPFELDLLQDDKKFAEAAAALTASLAALASESRAAASEPMQNESPQMEPLQDDSTQDKSTQNRRLLNRNRCVLRRPLSRRPISCSKRRSKQQIPTIPNCPASRARRIRYCPGLNCYRVRETIRPNCLSRCRKGG